MGIISPRAAALTGLTLGSGVLVLQTMGGACQMFRFVEQVTNAHSRGVLRRKGSSTHRPSVVIILFEKPNIYQGLSMTEPEEELADKSLNH